MNERIKELAEQAELELTIETKKFAELIVGECVSIADEYDGVGSTIVSWIREYFGVEE